MRLGIMLERAEEVSRMLDVKYHFLMPRLEDIGGAADLLQWAGVLRSASALEAYRKRFGNAIKLDNVIDILLFDPTFPRSARYSIESLEVSLRRIASKGETPRRDSARRRRSARQTCGWRKRPRLSKRDCTSSCFTSRNPATQSSTQIYDQYLKAE